MANGALAPLLLSIFLGPIGAEGYVLRNSCANLTAGVRNVALGSSIAKHVLLGAIVIMSVIEVWKMRLYNKKEIHDANSLIRRIKEIKTTWTNDAGFNSYVDSILNLSDSEKRKVINDILDDDIDEEEKVVKIKSVLSVPRSSSFGVGAIINRLMMLALSITCIVAIINVIVAWGQCS